jgi:hypothetical protein
LSNNPASAFLNDQRRALLIKIGKQQHERRTVHCRYQTPRKVLTPLYINLKQIPLAAKALAHNVSANSELIDTHEDAAGRSDSMRYNADNYTLSVL